ncbi:MAG: hypothetical protein JNL84_06170 [Candidatus Accumulibacter sp.]|nr:hypothetical protein [Accumulibacter sp.]
MFTRKTRPESRPVAKARGARSPGPIRVEKVAVEGRRNVPPSMIRSMTVKPAGWTSAHVVLIWQTAAKSIMLASPEHKDHGE